MGEDRWLCTLLIQKGWKLQYSAVSQDHTFCPETFEEFYKQRRRWIPSTIANLVLVIDNWKKITSNNSSITILFILYQFLIVFSSLISPATVILIIVSGVKAIDPSASETALIVVLSIISVLYGVICIYTTEKTQLRISKFLTFVFLIIMAVVMSGILSETIDSLVAGNEMGEHDNNTDNENFQFPVDINALYSGMFAITFIMAGIFHFNEIFCMSHFIWYLLCLPSAYMFLIIYSVCNLNNRSWGTREGIKPRRSSNSGSWLDFFKWSCLCGLLNKCGIKKTQQFEPIEAGPTEDLMVITAGSTYSITTKPSELDEDVKEWLCKNGCDVSKTCKTVVYIYAT